MLLMHFYVCLNIKKSLYTRVLYKNKIKKMVQCSDYLIESSLPLAKSSSSFLFVDVEGSFATKAGLAFACSAACEDNNHVLHINNDLHSWLKRIKERGWILSKPREILALQIEWART